MTKITVYYNAHKDPVTYNTATLQWSFRQNNCDFYRAYAQGDKTGRRYLAIFSKWPGQLRMALERFEPYMEGMHYDE